MADVGKSTLAHQDGAGDIAMDYAETVQKLSCWGDWQSSLPGGGSTTSPMFRDMKEGYRENSGRVLNYDEDEALWMDGLIATFCTPFEVRLLFCRFVFQQSSRSVSRELEAEGAMHDGSKITVHHVLRLLDNTVARMDVAIELSEQSKKK